MDYQIDHDFHVHSYLSPCARELAKAQTPQAMITYARQNGMTKVAITDHFWDSAMPGSVGWYQDLHLDVAHVSQILPLPKEEDVQLFFGCEVEMDQCMTIGLAKENYDKFDFIVVATNHLHLEGITVPAGPLSVQQRVDIYQNRFQALLDADLPFHKVGVAHLTCPLLGGYDDFSMHLQVPDLIPDETFRDLFRQTAEKGMGVELNFLLSQYGAEDIPRVLRPYRIAKECGCKFYLGSDAHHPKQFEGAAKNFSKIVKLLELQETDKFHFPAEQGG